MRKQMILTFLCSRPRQKEPNKPTTFAQIIETSQVFPISKEKPSLMTTWMQTYFHCLTMGNHLHLVRRRQVLLAVIWHQPWVPIKKRFTRTLFVPLSSSTTSSRITHLKMMLIATRICNNSRFTYLLVLLIIRLPRLNSRSKMSSSMLWVTRMMKATPCNRC